ncbi:conserved repeat domain-containing protein [Sphingomonas sp. OK281]|nr:conserved repeat domain-containing protein [Sphingomonas sp. OK281]
MHAKGVIRTLMAGTAAIVSFGTASAQTAPGPAGTAAGTTISNTALASYTVNGVQQTTSSNAATFLVDLKANLTVAPLGGNTPVTIGESGAVLKFTVTNNTNGTQDFLLTHVQSFLGGIFAGDNFNVDNVRIIVDSNGDNEYTAADTATYINELGADQTKTVFIVADVPANQAAALASVTLIAQIAQGGDPLKAGDPLVSNALTANRDGVVDVVFADNDSGFGDAALNGYGRSTLAYEITTRNVDLTIVKSSTVVSDPINLLVTPKAIPGAVVRYCLVVRNATVATPARNVNLTDLIPTNTTYEAGSLSVGGVAVGGECLTDGVTLTDAGGTVLPVSGITGSYDGTAKQVKVTIPTLTSLLPVAASFRVKIN